MVNGWISVHRKIIDSVVWQNPTLLKTWLWVLLSAAYQCKTVRFSGENVKLQPGEFIAGRVTGAEACDLPHSTFWDHLQRLKAHGMINMKSDNRKTLITVVNWGEYQGVAAESDSQPTTSRQPADTTNKGIREKRRGARSSRIPINVPEGVRLFHTVTGKYPKKALFDDINAAISGKTTEEVQPFYKEWLARGYNPASTKWATEWAASGEIPTNGRPKKVAKQRDGLIEITGETPPYQDG